MATKEETLTELAKAIKAISDTVEKNKNTQSFIDYFNAKLENIKQIKEDAILDRESKWTSIKYTKRAYIISIIAIFCLLYL